MPRTYDLDDSCPQPGCDGILTLSMDGECTCHQHPPCPAHEQAVLECSACGWRLDDEA